jgi:plastocyanin
MATKDAFGAGFKPSEATIDAGSLGWVHARALHHAIHQLGAMKIPNKHRLATAKYAHLNRLRAGLL